MSCEVHRFHAPEPQVLHRHHVIPAAWTRTLGLPPSRTVLVGGTCHDNLHRDLRHALRGIAYRAGPASKALIEEAVAFYNAHPEAHDRLWTLADELAG